MKTEDQHVRETFIMLADTLVADFDLIDFLDVLAGRCADLVGAAACGLLLVDHRGTLTTVAASGEEARLLELFQSQHSEGPCFDCYRGGAPVSCPDLTDAGGRWPGFAAAALSAGLAAVHALPMRLRDEVIGAMSLFTATPGPLSAAALELGRGLADMATIGILHERVVRRHEVVTEQLQTALHSRILIEQAKGVLAERLGIPPAAAFTALRSHARTGNRKLLDVARAVVDGSLTIRPADSDRTST
ncbi:GAF and ANTAR domain-containing protein [Actinosynnema sp. CS-041913]|uniref:GAF and ANTAR domain-containing protein n=1 Tax=Actinosynnema sp. CS-041913 TaxID=3239917 RepID=UPI003D9151D6